MTDGTDLLVEIVTGQIQGQNWSDEKLTDRELVLIDLAVRATIDNIAPHEKIRQGLQALERKGNKPQKGQT